MIEIFEIEKFIRDFVLSGTSSLYFFGLLHVRSLLKKLVVSTLLVNEMEVFPV